MNRTKRAGVLAGLMAGALAISACSGGGSGDGSGGDDEENVYVYAIDDDPRGMNAQLVGAPMTAMFSSQMLEPLIFLSSEFEFSPALAESWEFEDGLDLTLNLRQGVTWHDGEPFTAEDVKFNFEEIVPLSSFGAPMAERLDSVEIVDDATVIIHMKETYGPLLETVAMQYMVPKHIYEGTDYVTNEANMAPIGTGPMMFDSYASGEQITLVKNPDYWGGEVTVDRGIFPIMGDTNSRAEALFAGEVDQAVIDVSQQDRVSEDPNTKLLENVGYPQDINAMFNGKSEVLEDPAVRRAVFAAIDRDAIAETALEGLATPANGFFPETLDWAVSPNVDFSEQFPHDVDAINEALDDAGFEKDSNGTRFTLDIRYTSERTDTAAMAEMMASMFDEVGIDTELVGTSAAVFTAKVYTESDFDLAILPSTVGADPSTGITRWYTCNEDKSASANPSQICDPEIDKAADAALETSSKEERGKAFTALQDRAAELMFYAPLVWFNGQFPTVNSTRWEGQDEPQPITNRIPWTSMTPVE